MHLRCGSRSAERAAEGGYADDDDDAVGGAEREGLSIRSVRYTSCESSTDCVDASERIGVCARCTRVSSWMDRHTQEQVELTVSASSSSTLIPGVAVTILLM